MKKLILFLTILSGFILLFAVGLLINIEAGVISSGIGMAMALPFIPVGSSVSEELRKLTEERGGLMLRLKALTDVDTMTEEQRTEFDTLDDQIRKLDADIKELEAEEKRMLKIESRRNEIAGKPQKRVDGKDNDLSKFQFLNYMREVADGKLTGINLEMHQEAVREARALGQSINNFGIPEIVLTNKRDLNTTSTTGGYGVGYAAISYIEALQNALVLVEMGADFLTGLRGNVPMTSENAVAAAVWVAENGTATESNPTFTQSVLTPNRLATFTDVSKQLLLQDSVSIERRLMGQLVNAAAQALLTAAINGSGTAPTPRGILNVSGIGSVAIGTDGGALTWAKAVELETKVRAANAVLNGKYGYLTNSKVIGAAKTIAKASNAALFILENNAMNGYKVFETNAVPSNLTKGGTTTSCSAAIFGNFADLVIGQWGGLDIMANPYTKSKEALIEYQIDGFYDTKVLHPASFAACVDITTV